MSAQIEEAQDPIAQRAQEIADRRRAEEELAEESARQALREAQERRKAEEEARVLAEYRPARTPGYFDDPEAHKALQDASPELVESHVRAIGEAQYQKAEATLKRAAMQQGVEAPTRTDVLLATLVEAVNMQSALLYRAGEPFKVLTDQERETVAKTRRATAERQEAERLERAAKRKAEMDRKFYRLTVPGFER